MACKVRRTSFFWLADVCKKSGWAGDIVVQLCSIYAVGATVGVRSQTQRQAHQAGNIFSRIQGCCLMLEGPWHFKPLSSPNT